ncbi:MAG: putative 6-pyruvoyl tetrahydrobiopterin synthase [Phycisphaerales bacterium]|nr:putative 6-pyruvoyl tetrahydrobiopterin synthase [Phycisphaerales bacterium]
MYRLRRDVRLNFTPDAATGGSGHAGVPAVDSPAIQLTVGVTLAGEPDKVSGYLIDIKAVDDAVRRLAFARLSDAILFRRLALPGLAAMTFDFLKDAWPGRQVERIELAMSPYQYSAVIAGEPSVTQLSHRFEFSAAHRLHNPDLSEEENRQMFGKCNNPAGHGHNYEVAVTLVGTPDLAGRLVSTVDLERLVEEHAISKVDHKHLNEQVPAFAELNPSVEYIARVIYGWLKEPLKTGNASLRSVTVWETPKTSCEYSENADKASAAVRIV